MISTRNFKLNMFCAAGLFFFSGCNQTVRTKGNQVEGDKYVVAAYVWPSCHDEPIIRDVLWGKGIGEWEIIQKGVPRFEGHYQPRLPLWGYKMDNDPAAWEQKIDAATGHGVNTFIFDWYWYDGKPFLEEAINKGFLGAANNDKMNFYLMWANHDVPGNMWNHFRYPTDSLLWNGEVDWPNFRIIVNRVINQYFKRSNYMKLNGEPVFSIYSIADLVQSFGNLEEAGKALEYFGEEVKKEGFPGLHIQLVGKDAGGTPHLEIDTSVNIVVKALGAKSVTMYNMAGSYSRKEDYLLYGEAGVKLRSRWDSILTVPYIPCVSVGWDTTPRFPGLGKTDVIHRNNTPESFGAYLLKAKEYAGDHPEQPRFIIINAWNEWVEGSYLEPDMKWGYGYLEAVKKVMSGKYGH